MISFKQFLAESLALDTPKHGLTVRGLQAFTSNTPNKQARYVIDSSGKIHAGNPRNFIHSDIYDGKDDQIRGYIRQKKNGEIEHHPTYTYNKNGEGDRPDKDHPHLKQFTKAGIKTSGGYFPRWINDGYAT